MASHEAAPPAHRKHPIRISYTHPNAQPPIYVAGSFTSPPWTPQQLVYDHHGGTEYRFYQDFQIPEGEWQYKFRLGEGDWWVLDESAETGVDAAGNRNNLLIVKPSPDNTKLQHQHTPSTAKMADPKEDTELPHDPSHDHTPPQESTETEPQAELLDGHVAEDTVKEAEEQHQPTTHTEQTPAPLPLTEPTPDPVVEHEPSQPTPDNAKVEVKEVSGSDSEDEKHEPEVETVAQEPTQQPPPPTSDPEKEPPSAEEPTVQENGPVPITVVETVPDQEQPMYGSEREADSLKEDGRKREADAEPDEIHEFKEEKKAEATEDPLEPEPAEEIPTVIVEKTDDEPARGDDFGPDATIGQKLAHEMRSEDAEPDKVVISPDSGPADPPALPEPVELEAVEEKQTAEPEAEIAEHSTAPAEVQTEEPVKDEGPASEEQPEEGLEPKAPSEEVPETSNAPLLAHEELHEGTDLPAVDEPSASEVATTAAEVADVAEQLEDTPEAREGATEAPGVPDHEETEPVVVEQAGVVIKESVSGPEIVVIEETERAEPEPKAPQVEGSGAPLLAHEETHQDADLPVEDEASAAEVATTAAEVADVAEKLDENTKDVEPVAEVPVAPELDEAEPGIAEQANDVNPESIPEPEIVEEAEAEPVMDVPQEESEAPILAHEEAHQNADVPAEDKASAVEAATAAEVADVAEKLDDDLKEAAPLAEVPIAPEHDEAEPVVAEQAAIVIPESIPAPEAVVEQLEAEPAVDVPREESEAPILAHEETHAEPREETLEGIQELKEREPEPKAAIEEVPVVPESAAVEEEPTVPASHEPEEEPSAPLPQEAEESVVPASHDPEEESSAPLLAHEIEEPAASAPHDTEESGAALLDHEGKESALPASHDMEESEAPLPAHEAEKSIAPISNDAEEESGAPLLAHEEIHEVKQATLDELPKTPEIATAAAEIADEAQKLDASVQEEPSSLSVAKDETLIDRHQFDSPGLATPDSQSRPDSPWVDHSPLFAHEQLTHTVETSVEVPKPKPSKLKDVFADDFDDPSLEPFPQERESILRRISTTGSRLAEDETYVGGIPPSPVLTPGSQVGEFLVKSTSTRSFPSPPGSSLGSIIEEEPEISERIPFLEQTHVVAGSSVDGAPDGGTPLVEAVSQKILDPPSEAINFTDDNPSAEEMKSMHEAPQQKDLVPQDDLEHLNDTKPPPGPSAKTGPSLPELNSDGPNGETAVRRRKPYVESDHVNIAPSSDDRGKPKDKRMLPGFFGRFISKLCGGNRRAELVVSTALVIASGYALYSYFFL